MANNRIAIKAAIQSLLMNATDANDNVYTNRKSNLWASEVPAILVYTLIEPATLARLQGQVYVRDLEVKLDIKVKASESSDDVLDALVAQVETIMANNPGLSGTVRSTIQKHTEIIVDSGADSDVAVATLTFECKYIS